MLGLTAVFGEAARAARLHADDFMTFILPVGLLQGAGFTGAATGVNLARDIEQGWFDRLLAAPRRRGSTLLAGIVRLGGLRALLPGDVPADRRRSRSASHLPGVDGARCIASCSSWASPPSWPAAASIVALRFRTQPAAPLMQVGSFIAVLFTTAYAPLALLAGWLRRSRRSTP